MEAAKHTPGPWRVSSRDAHDILADIEADCQTLVARTMQFSQAGGAADATLIAAAPEMHEILAFIKDGTIDDPDGSGGVQAMDAPYDTGNGWTTLGEVIEAALARAAGRTDTPAASREAAGDASAAEATHLPHRPAWTVVGTYDDNGQRWADVAYSDSAEHAESIAPEGVTVAAVLLGVCEVVA
jgi:hypothetical protein